MSYEEEDTCMVRGCMRDASVTNSKTVTHSLIVSFFFFFSLSLSLSLLLSSFPSRLFSL